MAEKQDPPSSEPLFKQFTIVEAKHTYSYVILSFPVLTVNLRHVKYQMTDEDGEVKVLDGFMRECLSMQCSFPAIVGVEI